MWYRVYGIWYICYVSSHLLHDPLNEAVSEPEGGRGKGVGDGGLDIIVVVPSEAGLLRGQAVLVHIVHAFVWKRERERERERFFNLTFSTVNCISP